MLDHSRGQKQSRARPTHAEPKRKREACHDHSDPPRTRLRIYFRHRGKSFLSAVASVAKSRFSVNFGSKLMGIPQVAFKIPFAFPLALGGNAYDFSRDLSTIVYARPGGHADLIY